MPILKELREEAPLSGVRLPELLDRLPEAERAEWRQEKTKVKRLK
jgi:hypothetical protein